MRLRDFITEMPISGWVSDPDMAERENTMVSKFRNWETKQVHYVPADKAAIKQPDNIIRAFSKSPYRFNIYFHQLDDPNYDPYLQKGEVDLSWLEKKKISIPYQPDAINIVITNNLSDERKISFKSPWIVAHRIGHAIEGRDNKFGYKFKEFLFKIATVGYGIYWSTPDEDYGMYHEMFDIYGKIFGHHLGTMKSARDGHLVNSSEWAMETFAQYIMTGGIRMNPLPERLHDDEILTNDPVKLKKLNSLMQDFPKLLMSYFHRILSRSVGKIYVV